MLSHRLRLSRTAEDAGFLHFFSFFMLYSHIYIWDPFSLSYTDVLYIWQCLLETRGKERLQLIAFCPVSFPEAVCAGVTLFSELKVAVLASISLPLVLCQSGL